MGSNPTLSAINVRFNRPFGPQRTMRKSEFAALSKAAHKFDVGRRARLQSRERRRRLPPFKLLRRLGLKRGEVFVDIGCGTGFFSIPAARIVGPAGKVYGLDISPVMLADLRAAAAREKIQNIVPVRASEEGREIPRRASLYLFANVFHELDDKDAVLRRLRRRMGRPSRLAVLDYHKRRTAYGPPPSQRISLSALLERLKKSGFRIQEVFDVNAEEYMVVARIPGPAKEGL